MIILKQKKKVIWNSKIRIFLQKIGYGDVWLQQNHSLDTKRFLKDVKQRLQDMEYQKWMSEIFNDKGRTGKQRNKLRVYRTFKTEYKYESYLDHIIDTKHRINFTRSIANQ